MELTAFHGSDAIKAQYLTRLQAHAAADEIIHGTGWDGGKGCAAAPPAARSNEAKRVAQG